MQYVYLAVACAGAAVAVLFFFAKLPEVQEESKKASARRGSVAEDTTLELGVDENGNIIGDEPIWKQYNMLCGFGAQFCYVGAQVTIATFFINYATENAGYGAPEAAQMLSYALITFTVGRFIATGLATIFESNFLMVIYCIAAIAFTAYVSAGSGISAVAILILVFFWMAPMYPTIFTLGTANLGRHTRRGAGILVMGVSGGGVFPPIQGAIADRYSTRISYLVPTCGFVVVLVYVLNHWVRNGFPIMRRKGPGTSFSPFKKLIDTDILTSSQPKSRLPSKAALSAVSCRLSTTMKSDCPSLRETRSAAAVSARSTSRVSLVASTVARSNRQMMGGLRMTGVWEGYDDANFAAATMIPQQLVFHGLYICNDVARSSLDSR